MTSISRTATRCTGLAHSNDQMRICDSEWYGVITTADPRTPNWYDCGSQVFDQGRPVSVDSQPMPPTNAEMKNEVRVDLPDTVARPGCLYTGPTTITFNSNGTMTVISPWTKVTQPSYTVGTPSKSPVECGTIYGLNSYAGATIPVIDHNLIYVQDVPSATATGIEPNRPSSASFLPRRFTCTGSGASSGWQFRQVAANPGPGSAFRTMATRLRRPRWRRGHPSRPRRTRPTTVDAATSSCAARSTAPSRSRRRPST